MLEHTTNEKTTTSSNNNTSIEPQPTPSKKAKGTYKLISKIPGQCLGQTYRLSVDVDVFGCGRISGVVES